MRTLVVGAGAIGGYFGGRMLEAGRDVTFLVRPGRAAQLAETGLVLTSGAGDYHHPAPPTVLAEALDRPFDLILLSCKAYDLEDAIRSFAPAVGPATAILPLLNGMRHMDRLAERFGPEAVLGGYCAISSTLGGEGRIHHLNDLHLLVFGERNGAGSARTAAVAAELAGLRCDTRASATILQDMWEKWVFIATAAGITCLMRAAIGELVAAGGAGLALALHEECAAIAAAQGFPPREKAAQMVRALVTAEGSPLKASMLRDIERAGPTEAEHVLGDLLRRGAQAPLLTAAYVHVAAYERGRPKA